MSLLGANASLASVSGGGGAHVTALHFISAAGALARGRRLSPHKPRRRLKISGWEMSGNLYTLGYFSAQICIGSPQRSFDLIVDTGSALTALPCDGCPHCGTHKHGGQNGMRFSESSSSSAEAVARSRPPPGMSRCRSCDASKCGWPEVVSVLLEAGARTEIRRKNGRTPLLEACGEGKVSCVRRLLAAGADATATDAEGATAMQLAASAAKGAGACVAALQSRACMAGRGC